MTDPAGLLKTILADDRLARRLAEMPADSKTVTLTLPNEPRSFAHPQWQYSAEIDSDSQETLALPGDGQDDGRRDGRPKLDDCDGYVPRRRVADLGQGKHCDADYRLVGKLGSGGTGIVYQAHQRAIDREVAVKTLRQELSADRQQRSRFLTEARVIGGLDHPNVIALHELCIDEQDGLFYSMKRIDGSSWDQQIASMSIDENLRVLLRVADAIRYAHSRGLVHRDIKPENVMLGQYGEVLLADWGLAISLSADGALATGSDSAIGGTPAYMAPELAMGDPTLVTFQTDVYLLGAALFQLLSGFPPHHGKSLLECIQAAASNLIRETDVDGELMKIARKAMATRPSDRYADVQHFIQAIQDQQTHRQSVQLVRRAEAILKEADAEQGYESFRLAEAILREAITAWPENQRAHTAIGELQRHFASVAANRGDLDLALSLYESAGEGDSEVSIRIRRARDKRNRHARGEAKYSVLFSRSPEAGLLIRSSDGTIAEANDAFFEWLGYDADHIVGSPLGGLGLWQNEADRDEFLERIATQERVDNFETILLHDNGQPFNVLISARTLNVNRAEVCVLTIRDITRLREADRALQQSRRRLRDLQRLAGLGTWEFDVTSQTIRWSEELYRLVGHDSARAPLDLERYLETLHPADRDRFRDVVNSTIEQGVAYEMKIRQGTIGDVKSELPESQRQYREVIARGQPTMDDNGQVVEVYGVLIPVSGTKSGDGFPRS